jgi:hypothetical protein
MTQPHREKGTAVNNPTKQQPRHMCPICWAKWVPPGERRCPDCAAGFPPTSKPSSKDRTSHAVP